MAKGQAQAADKQLGVTNNLGQQQGQEATKLENSLIPGYTSLMNTGYVNPEQKEAAVTSEMGAATAPFAAADFQAANRASATNNPADLTASADQLALEKGRAAGGAASNLQNEQMNNQEAGMYGIQGLEQGNLTAEEAMYGLGPGTLQARAAGAPPIGLQIAQGALGAAGAAAA